jgi:hypothetical protein
MSDARLAWLARVPDWPIVRLVAALALGLIAALATFAVLIDLARSLGVHV